MENMLRRIGVFEKDIPSHEMTVEKTRVKLLKKNQKDMAHDLAVTKTERQMTLFQKINEETEIWNELIEPIKSIIRWSSSEEYDGTVGFSIFESNGILYEAPEEIIIEFLELGLDLKYKSTVSTEKDEEIYKTIIFVGT